MKLAPVNEQLNAPASDRVGAVSSGIGAALDRAKGCDSGNCSCRNWKLEMSSSGIE